MNEIKVAAESLSALFEYNWYLIRGRALHEEPAKERAEVTAMGLITLMVEINQLIQPPLPSSSSRSVELVWTLPAGLNLPSHRQPQRSILDLILAVIASAQERLWLVSPFLNEAGLEQIFEAILLALQRGGSLVVVTHYLQDLSSPNSRAIERLYRESATLGSRFQAYTSLKEAEGEGVPHPLLHAKIVMADNKQGYLGSANLTGYGLRSNLEIGLRLNEPEAQEIENLLLT